MICVCQRDGKQKSCGEPQKFLVLDRCGERSTRERKEEGKKIRGKIVSERQSKAGRVLEGVLQCVAVCCRILQCVAVCCSVLQCVAVCCGLLQCVAVCCSVCLPYSAVCCSVQCEWL